MPNPIAGLHHVTAIASDPQRNLDFYTTKMGLRFVKRTINFDDPGSYHFYFGDYAGTPGTILTFFPWPGGFPGLRGSGEVAQVAFSVPPLSIEFWLRHLQGHAIPAELLGKRFGADVISLMDPDGMKIELVGHEETAPIQVPRDSFVPTEHAIRGFYGVTLLEKRLDETTAVLNKMGFRKVGEENGRMRLAADGPALGTRIDIIADPEARRGRLGAGTVHHIAFRAQDDEDQLAWREVIAEDLEVTPVVDRTYFHSIYFREPGGVLFEIATDPPGFSVDEATEHLGERLQLPPWLESKRDQIEQRLPQIRLPKTYVPV